MEKYGHTHLNIRQMHLLSPHYVYQKGHTHGKNNTQLQNVLTFIFNLSLLHLALYLLG